MESVGRMFLCARCSERTVLCSRCDRGQIYCGQTPSRHALKLSVPPASGISPAMLGESTMSSERGGGVCGRRIDVLRAKRTPTL